MKNTSTLSGIACVKSVNDYLYAGNDDLAIDLLSAALAIIGYALLR